MTQKNAITWGHKEGDTSIIAKHVTEQRPSLGTFCLNPPLQGTRNFRPRQLKSAPKGCSVTLQRGGWEWQTSVSDLLSSETLYSLAGEGLQPQRVIRAAFPLEAGLVPGRVSVKPKVTCACQERIRRVSAGSLAADALLYPVSQEREKSLSLLEGILTGGQVLPRHAEI